MAMIPEVLVHGLEGDTAARLDDQVGVRGLERGRGGLERPWLHVIEHHDVRASARLVRKGKRVR